jgi:hypothetical protein
MNKPVTETVAATKKGQKPLHFAKGGLHRSTGTPAGETIPASKKKAALSGKYGAKAKKEAEFAKNVLVGKKGRKKKRRKKK